MIRLDHALKDTSAQLARRILDRGIKRLSAIIEKEFASDDFSHVACPDFSITLRQRRMVLGLPIGSYVNFSKHPFFPIELDVNSCGVHLIRLPEPIDHEELRKRLSGVRKRLDGKELVIGDTVLKWNFSRRNHFISICYNKGGEQFILVHAGGETQLFDWEMLNRRFSVRRVQVDGREVPYIVGRDAAEYSNIAAKENEFFRIRHLRIFEELLGSRFEVVYADLHFGMISQGEILMGCSKLRVGAVFPILTRPFERIVMAKVLPPKDLRTLEVSGGYAIVPHGLGMTVPKDIVDIVGDPFDTECVYVVHASGRRMLTDTLEYAGVGYREIAVLPAMAELGDFEVLSMLEPKLCFKL